MTTAREGTAVRVTRAHAHVRSSRVGRETRDYLKSLLVFCVYYCVRVYRLSFVVGTQRNSISGFVW